MIYSIACLTDFSPASRVAFLHALALALTYRCRLYLVHAHGAAEHHSFDEFPHIRDTLRTWGLVTDKAEPEDVERITGVVVRKVDVRSDDPIEGLSEFLMGREPSLIVAATQTGGRQGVFASGSISAGVMRETRVPTLFFGPGFDRAFVDPRNGSIRLQSALMAIDAQPDPRPAIRTVREIIAPLGATLRLAHVGTAPPQVAVGDPPVELLLLEDSVGNTLLGAGRHVDLIAMPTDPAKRVLARLLGSATTNVLTRAATPVLLIPADMD